MIALTNTQRQLELDLASASSATLDVIVTFTDIRYADQGKNAGTQLSNSNGVTDVIICSAPLSGVLRIIESISVTNVENTATETARIYYDENGTEFNIIEVDLEGGDQLFYEDNQGWKVLSGVGSIKTVASGADHGTLVGLADDDHSQYALLAGRATGQTLIGGTAASDNVTIRATSNATLGQVILADQGGNVRLGGAATAGRLQFMEPSGSGTNFSSLRAGAQAGNIEYVLPLSAGTDGQVLAISSSANLYFTTAAGGGFTQGTEATLTGTAVDFTGIPAGTEIIMVTIEGMSTNGTARIQLQIGDAGGIEATGYSGGGAYHIAAGNTIETMTTGFWGVTDGAASTAEATWRLVLKDSTNFTWSCTSNWFSSGNPLLAQSSGTKTLTAELDRVRITTVSAGDSFDAGSVNIAYSS